MKYVFVIFVYFIACLFIANFSSPQSYSKQEAVNATQENRNIDLERRLTALESGRGFNADNIRRIEVALLAQELCVNDTQVRVAGIQMQVNVLWSIVSLVVGGGSVAGIYTTRRRKTNT